MESDDFILRVRTAGETHVYRFRGAEAVELHQLRANGQLERPGGTRQLTELVRDREPEQRFDGGASNGGDAHFDIVADDELREWLSTRLLERKGWRENAGPPEGDTPTHGAVDSPSP